MEDKRQDHETTGTTEQGCRSDINVFGELGPVVNKFMIPKTKLLISKETNCFRNKFSKSSKTTLNNIFRANFKDLFFELEIFCNAPASSINTISSIEDIKNSLYEHFTFEYSELISSITIDNLPSIIITLYLNNLESLYFQLNNIGYYLLHAAMKLNSLTNPVISIPHNKVIFYHVGYFNKEKISEFIKSIGIKKYSRNPIDPVPRPDFLTVTKDYQLALKAFNETKRVNCIFELHYFENEGTLNTIFTLNEIYNKDIYFISIHEQFDLSKIIKLDNNNKYKVILNFSNDKVADFNRGYSLNINMEDNCKHILSIIKKNRNTISLQISTNINSDSLNLIVESVVKKKIRPQVIEYNNYDFFTDKNIERLIPLFYNNKDLREIVGSQHLYDSLTSFGTKKLHQTLIFNKTLLLLDLSNNNIGSEGSKFIASMIKDCKSLQQLSLGNNNIGNEGVKLIAEALKTENIIEKITLDMNDISDIGLAYICETIRVNDILRFLTLDDNFITNEGLKMFANALAANYSLVSVNFENNPFTKECVSYLFDIFNPNKTGRYAGSRDIYLKSEGFKLDEPHSLKMNNFTINIS
jgi:hypothetical protein